MSGVLIIPIIKELERLKKLEQQPQPRIYIEKHEEQDVDTHVHIEKENPNKVDFDISDKWNI